MATRADLPSSHPVRAFGQPAWWLALAVLVVNDHVLKGAGLLPGWLTGKLSDFAGLLVAPPLVAALLGGRARRGLVVAAVGSCFAGMKLSPTLAQASEAVLGAIGLAWRIRPDPTDLAALVVLPLAYAWSRRASGPTTGFARLVRGSALAVGTLACLGSGTEGASPDRPEGPGVHNEGEDRAMVIVASTEGVGGCDLYTSDRISILTASAYSERRELEIEPGDVEPLGGGECGAAWIQLDGSDDVHVFWRELEPLDDFVSLDDPERLARAARLVGRPGRWRVELGEDLHEFDPSRAPPGSSCPDSTVEHTLRWTDLPWSHAWLELVSTARDADGCLEVVWRGDFDGGADFTQTLCIPDWAFPFAEGEIASVIVEGTSERGQLRITHYEQAKLTEQLLLWAHAETVEDEPFEGVEAEECFGALTACGAYTRPVRVRVQGDEELLPGEEIEVETDDADVRVLVGPAVDVGWSGTDCPPGEAIVGPNVSVLALRKP